MPCRTLLMSMIAATLLLWGLTLATLTFAGVSAYDANRVVLLDCKLDPYEEPEVSGGPTMMQLPTQQLYAGQTCVNLDERDVEGNLVVWTDNQSGVVDEMSYSFQACLPCEAGDDPYTCTRSCYALADTARTDGYTWDGREYSMVSGNGSDYPVHWIRRETDPASFDPSAIFQLSMTMGDRAITLLMFYRLSTAD